MADQNKPEPTIWRVPDDLWEIIETVLEKAYPKAPHDRKRVALRPVLDGILFKLRTGCHWNQIPKEFGDDSTIHRHFQAWCHLGIVEEIWRRLILECEELRGVQWEWQSADTSMGKARGKSKMGEDATGRNPTDRGKKG